jgi:predicted GTPase
MSKVRTSYKVSLCKICGESDPEKFYDGRYSLCKICRNKEKNKTAMIKKLETEEPENFTEKFNHFILNDTRLFGASHYQVIKELQDNVKEIESLKNENKELKNKLEDFQIELLNLKNKFKN